MVSPAYMYACYMIISNSRENSNRKKDSNMALVHITFQYSHNGNQSSQERTIPETDIPHSNMALVHITFQYSHHGNKSSQEQTIPEADIPHSNMALVHITF